MRLPSLCAFLLCLLAASATPRSPAQEPRGIAAGATAAPAAEDSESVWKSRSEAHAAALTQRFGAGTDPALRDQLLSLLARDRQARGLEASPDGKKPPVSHLAETDAKLSAELRTLVEAHGWPTVALVGLPASNAAMVLLTHAPDHDWQRALLPVVEQLADAGKIDPAPLAAVIDKELVSEGKLQRYGTQFRVVRGAMVMYAVEDPASLDKRRERAALPPIAVYRAMLSRMYGLAAGPGVVSAPS